MEDEKEDRRERYFWDLTGYLIVRAVLTPEEVAAANTAIDTLTKQITILDKGTRDSRFLKGTGARWYGGESLLNLPKPHCHPFRALLAHPAVVSRLNWMCGPGFRLDHGPQFNNAIKGTEGLSLHGAGGAAQRIRRLPPPKRPELLRRRDCDLESYRLPGGGRRFCLCPGQPQFALSHAKGCAQQR